jgi:hypothetical protein
VSAALEIVVDRGAKPRRLSAIVIVSRSSRLSSSRALRSSHLGAWRGAAGSATLAAVGALSLEGLLVVLSRGNCPLGPLFRRLGDEKPFFALLLPPRAAKLAVPVLAAVTIVGVVLLALRAP